MSLIKVQDALDIILKNSENFGIEGIDFKDAVGRILKEDILADRDFPPFNRVSMDGIAIAVKPFEEGQRKFKVSGIQPAGSAQLTLKNQDNCIEAMTGCVLPKNAEAVIQYELVDINDGVATVLTDDIKYFKNVHKKGLDRKDGDLLIKKDTVISSAEIGVFATVGKSTVKVAKQPKVLIISTGDELVDVNNTPEYYQIRRSNVYTLVSILENHKIPSTTVHILDDKETLKKKVDGYLNNYDVLLFSGAVSKGKFDFIPEVLDELGVEKLFHRVKQRPGKPFWFGKKGSATIFAFPGNPVSTFVSCLKYFIPWYQKSSNINFLNPNKAVLAENFTFKPDLTYFLQVKLENKDGILMAFPVMGNGSGDLANLVDADAFIELPNDKSDFKKGEVFPLIMYR